MGGPFDRVGVDVVQLPTSRMGSKYAVVFIDNLRKWQKVYRNQSSLMIAKLLVEYIIPQHGVPSQLLSYQGAAFLSKIMIMFELYKLLGIKKVSIMLAVQVLLRL